MTSEPHQVPDVVADTDKPPVNKICMAERTTPDLFDSYQRNRTPVWSRREKNLS